MMKSDTTLQLGDFIFASLEIPANIGFGGQQRLSVHQLVGGTKVIDAMGRADRPLEWSGIFLGNGAGDRARYLDTLRVQGQALTLKWGAFSYLVVVREFLASYEKSYQIPYRIVCEVVSDNTSPVTSPGRPPVDKAITDDAAAATTLTAGIGNSALTSAMGTLNTAISAVSSFAKAAQSTINGVLQPLAAVQAQVTTLIASVGNTVANVTTFGGILPGNPVSQAAAKLSGQAASMTQLGSLYQLRSVLGRMQTNLGAVTSSAKTVPTAGGNLFQVAESQYGDATAWTGIAKANGLTDPFIQGTKVLTIPPQADTLNGVLSA